MIQRLRNYVWTVNHLTIRQLTFRFWRAARGHRNVASRSPDCEHEAAPCFSVDTLPVTWESIDRSNGLTQANFLNRNQPFRESIDWSFMDHGLLWNYHLHYLNWLHQPEVDSALFQEYRHTGHGVGSSLDPYPTSLRIINTVKAVATGRLSPRSDVFAFVQSDCHNLRNNLEYHIGANHLLENGFGLLWGGLFLGDHKLWQKGKALVLTQMREQILEDGAHYERSSMYHAILLWRVLDTINLLSGYTSSIGQSIGVESVLRRYAARMLGWLHRYPRDNTRGHMNDSATDMSPARGDLLKYGLRLGITPKSVSLNESGFRVLGGPGRMQLLIDIGAPGPSHQPGHSHAGVLGFELYVNDQAIFVDTGTSTYDKSDRRKYERSTRAHNTVSIGRFDSSEVWSSFRIARRARVAVYQDAQSCLEASHDGYRRRFGIVHARRYDGFGDSIVITDRLSGGGAEHLSGTASFIIAPGLPIQRVDYYGFTIGKVGMRFDGAPRIRTEEVSIASGFNRLVQTCAIRVRFRKHLTTSLLLRTGGAI